MTNIKLTDENDWAIEDGNLAFTEGQEEISQIVKQRLLTFFGEWFLNTTIGVPYFQTIFEKGTNPAQIDSIFIDEIAGTPGIISLIDFDTELDTVSRTLRVVFTAQTVDGVINFDEVIT